MINKPTGIPVIHEMHVEADMNPFKAHEAQDDEASVASSVEDDHPFPVADARGHLAHYPREEEQQKHHHKVRLSLMLSCALGVDESAHNICSPCATGGPHRRSQSW